MAEKGKASAPKLISVRFLGGKETELPARIIVPLVVSKSAVVRNKIKRRAREILKAEGISCGLSLFFKKGSDALKFSELKEEIIRIIKQIK